jgi:drug/metabolite transporter (DMT)-like permease
VGGLALSLAGLACVAEVWGDLKLDGLGVLAGLAAAAFLALYYVLGAHGVRERDTLSLTTWAFGASAGAGLVTRAATAGTGGWEPLRDSSAGVPVPLLCAYVVVLGSIAPYLLVAAALRHLPATSVGIIGMVEPVIASAVAWVVLGGSEALNPAQLAGGALVLAGVALAETARVTTAHVTTARVTTAHVTTARVATARVATARVATARVATARVATARVTAAAEPPPVPDVVARG